MRHTKIIITTSGDTGNIRDRDIDDETDEDHEEQAVIVTVPNFVQNNFLLIKHLPLKYRNSLNLLQLPLKMLMNEFPCDDQEMTVLYHHTANCLHTTTQFLGKNQAKKHDNIVPGL